MSDFMLRYLYYLKSCGLISRYSFFEMSGSEWLRVDFFKPEHYLEHIIREYPEKEVFGFINDCLAKYGIYKDV